MQDHGVADRHVGDAVADGVHPARVLVADHVGERRVHRLGPVAVDDVQVGAAHARPTDLHDDVERTLERGLRDVVDLGILVVRVYPDGLHRGTSSTSVACARFQCEVPRLTTGSIPHGEKMLGGLRSAPRRARSSRPSAPPRRPPSAAPAAAARPGGGGPASPGRRARRRTPTSRGRARRSRWSTSAAERGDPQHGVQHPADDHAREAAARQRGEAGEHGVEQAGPGRGHHEDGAEPADPQRGRGDVQRHRDDGELVVGRRARVAGHGRGQRPQQGRDQHDPLRHPVGVAGAHDGADEHGRRAARGEQEAAARGEGRARTCRSSVAPSAPIGRPYASAARNPTPSSTSTSQSARGGDGRAVDAAQHVRQLRGAAGVRRAGAASRPGRARRRRRPRASPAARVTVAPRRTGSAVAASPPAEHRGGRGRPDGEADPAHRPPAAPPPACPPRHRRVPSP